MSEVSYDIVVVGGGPAGSMSARHAAMSGAKTLIIEEHRAAGSPVQCTGLVSSKTLDVCGIEPGPWVYQEVTGAHIFAPDGSIISIGGEKVRAYVIDRKMFDRHLLRLAVAGGVDVMLGTKAVGLHDADGMKVLEVVHGGRKMQIKAGVVIGADGVQGSIARWSGLGQVQKVLSGVQIETVYDVEDTDHVEVFVGHEVPGFFAWAVPVSDNVARIGLCVDQKRTHLSAYEHLMQFLTSNPRMKERAGRGFSDMLVGCIPLGPQSCTVADGVLITGDAAGQVKPTSGGGVYMGALCAQIGGEVAANAVLSGDTSTRALMEYDRRWREVVGRELAVGMRIHKVFGRLEDDDFNELVRFFGESEVLELINMYGDIDHPSVLLGKLVARAKGKKLLGVFRVALKAMVGKE
ncbi:MAG: NAD(P)/FAD-dependent oxidoreductase [ANME-2 cluster archaeon]|nr:NAD(P)/FAD-dependent oxidoreductase [ANME-2 cluster archaeon]MDF1531001.1 NAD(P)/FAD-dependent oxidoreductase [ANME-2 cluster archaeon]